jgi:hypothetical protein
MQIPPSNGKQGCAALTNNNQENFDQIHAHNWIKRIRFSLNAVATLI